jgi:hypothetical protein
MPSFSLGKWRTVRSASLDTIESAYNLATGAAAGRRSRARKMNQAYALLLSSEFQGFCRDLHTECVQAVVRTLPSVGLQELMRDGLLLGRKLGSGNPNPGNIGADFGRFGPGFWGRVEAAHPRNPRRKQLLEEMNRWRNAIAHDDFESGMLRGVHPALTLADIRRWRKACDGLARWFDRIMRGRLQAVLSTPPW